MSQTRPPYNVQPATVSDLFPRRFLHADDLKGQAFTLTITSVTFEEVTNFRKEKETKALVHFQGARKALLLNVTQARKIAEIAGSQQFAHWSGVEVMLRPGRATNGKPTILVEKPAGEAVPTE